MTTLNDLMLRVYRLLEDVPFLDFITAPVSASPSAGVINLVVNDPANWPAGSRYEIDQELFMIANSANSVNPVPVERAYEGTIAAAHPINASARRDPRFPNATIQEAINIAYGNWCSQWFPRLVWDTTTGGTFSVSNWIIPAPADALSVKRVTWQVPGFNRYRDVEYHTDLQDYPPTICPTGLGFELYERIGLPGTQINVLYEKRWPDLVNLTDSIDTTFPSDADELIPLGAILYICGVRMTPRLRVDEVLFYREQATPLPPAFNENWLVRAQQDWARRAKEVAGRRPDHAPSVVWVGRVG